MSLKFAVGLSQKIGQPNYGSLGASCHVELELDDPLLQNDPEAFQREVHTAYLACAEAVSEELARHENSHSPPANGQGNGHAGGGRAANARASNGAASKRGQGGSPAPQRGRRATISQVKAIHAIARRQGVDLAPILQERYQVGQPEELSVAQASDLIDALQVAADDPTSEEPLAR